MSKDRMSLRVYHGVQPRLLSHRHFLDDKIFLKTILLAQAKTLPVGLGSTTVAANDLTGLSDLLASTNHVLQVTLLHLVKSIKILLRIHKNHRLKLVCLSTKESIHITHIGFTCYSFGLPLN